MFGWVAFDRADFSHGTGPTGSRTAALDCTHPWFAAFLFHRPFSGKAFNARLATDFSIRRSLWTTARNAD